MNAFNRLPGFTRTPPGKERKVIRALPMIFLVGTLLLALPSIFVRFFPVDRNRNGNCHAHHEF
jgi:hypothetical protein